MENVNAFFFPTESVGKYKNSLHREKRLFSQASKKKEMTSDMSRLKRLLLPLCLV